MNYRFRIQPIIEGKAKRFQLRVGLPDDGDLDCIPVYRSAFAQRLPLEMAHDALADAHLELSRIISWLDGRKLSCG